VAAETARRGRKARETAQDSQTRVAVLFSPASAKMAAIGHTLEQRGWCVVDDALDAPTIQVLRLDLLARRARGALHHAGVGRGASQRVNSDIRGDQILWLDDETGAPARNLLRHFESLRIALNRSVVMGLSEFEAHYSWYPPGAAYQRHIDRHRDSDARMVSSVLYLNDDWPEDAGGALRLHFDPDDSVDIAPLGGRLVLFLSAQVEHEVLPATRDRLSIAGWFRRPVLAIGRAREAES
jgi:SM-20-related protein